MPGEKGGGNVQVCIFDWNENAWHNQTINATPNRRFTKYPSLMNQLIRLDGVQNIDAFFETTKEDEYKEKMIVDLSRMARKKADVLAKAQSRKVKSVYGITTEENFGQAYATFSLVYSPQAYALAMEADSYGMELVMAVPEFIKIGQRITAIYELK